ncbi:STAS domain-containing protein [Candidatus Poribacteria bacterium]|nr:STAS domain-containing protein [Candidatus Poribacteria bacterium]
MAITQSERDGVLIFKLEGRIIAPDVQDLTNVVQNALSQVNDSPKLVFDFKDVTGMDSSGLGALMKIYADIHPRDGTIAVINVNKHVKNLIVMARLITVFRNFETEDEAIWALLNPPSESPH